MCDELADDVTWDVAGAEVTSGLEDVRALVARLAERKVTGLRIRFLISHGNEVAAEGILTFDRGNERFVHLIAYAGHAKTAKISQILTYRG